MFIDANKPVIIYSRVDGADGLTGTYVCSAATVPYCVKV